MRFSRSRSHNNKKKGQKKQRGKKTVYYESLSISRDFFIRAFFADKYRYTEPIAEEKHV